MKPRLAGSVPYIPCSQGFRQSNRHIQIQRSHIYIEQYISYRCNHVYTYNLTNLTCCFQPLRMSWEQMRDEPGQPRFVDWVYGWVRAGLLCQGKRLFLSNCLFCLTWIAWIAWIVALRWNQNTTRRLVHHCITSFFSSWNLRRRAGQAPGSIQWTKSIANSSVSFDKHLPPRLPNRGRSLLATQGHRMAPINVSRKVAPCLTCKSCKLSEFH